MAQKLSCKPIILSNDPTCSHATHGSFSMLWSHIFCNGSGWRLSISVLVVLIVAVAGSVAGAVVVVGVGAGPPISIKVFRKIIE